LQYFLPESRILQLIPEEMMIRTAYYIIHIFFVFVFSLISLIPFLLIRVISGDKVWEKFLCADLSVWARFGLWGTGSTFEVSGLENLPEGNAVFMSNHQSNFDIFIVISYFKKLVGFIAKYELRHVPILNLWITLTHGIFINRKNMRDSYNTIEEGIKSLKDGNSLVIFPEGHRSKGPVPGNFKSGSFKLALLSNTRIVPVTIKDSYKIYEETGFIKPAHIKVTIHPPVETKGLSEEQKRTLPALVADIIKSAL